MSKEENLYRNVNSLTTNPYINLLISLYVLHDAMKTVQSIQDLAA